MIRSAWFPLFVVAAAVLVMSTTSLADPIEVYSTLGTNDSYDHGTSNPALEFGEVTDASPNVYWAMPFVPQYTGVLSSVDVALTLFDEDPPYSDSTLQDVEVYIAGDDNGKPGQPLIYWYPDGSPSAPLVPTCECDNYQGSAVIQLSVDSTVVMLEQDSPYWLVIGRWLDVSGHHVGHWYVNNQNITEVELDQVSRTRLFREDGGPWTAEATSGPLAAFRINSDSSPCDGLLEEPVIDGDCHIERLAPEDTRCWFSSAPNVWVPFEGFPLNLNLWQGFGPGDFPPLETEPVLSTLPLVASEARHHVGPRPHAKRPTQNKIIDLITGVPLMRAVDFELPFGGATFRHVRTYSENADKLVVANATDYGNHPPDGTFWDWNGMFWMMSESPILLVDARYTTSHPENATYFPGDERRCYLILDAHHAIPFRYFVGSDGQIKYAAPPWIDAVLDHNGITDLNAEDGWGQRPTEFKVWLQRGSIRYTFEVQYDDMFTMLGSSPVSAHRPGSEGGLGLPYYGIIKEIRDRNNHRIEYEYCDISQFPCDSNTIDGCTNCCQTCNEKGRPAVLRLVAGSETVWSLLYTYRGFQPLPAPDWWDGSYEGYEAAPIRMPTALHSIHVYQGYKNFASPCRTISAAEFCAAESLDELDSISFTEAPAPEDWVTQVRYLYSEWRRWSEFPDGSIYQDSCPAGEFFGEASTNGVAANDEGDQLPDPPGGWLPANYRIGQRLLKAAVTHRSTEQAQDIEQSHYTLYRDGWNPFGFKHENAESFLKAIWEPATVEAILAASGLSSPLEILPLADTEVVSVPDPQGLPGTVITKPLIQTADIETQPWPDSDGWEFSSYEIAQALVTFYGGDLARTQPWEFGRSVFRDRRASSDKPGDYAIFRFVQFPSTLPGEFDGYLGYQWGGLSGPPIFLRYPVTFRHPLLWNDSTNTDYHGLFTATADEPFWISVIDEKDPKASFYSPLGPNSAPVGALSRRVVEMNSLGFALRDRTWGFTEDASGQIEEQLGFSETRIYDSQGRVIELRSKGWDSPDNPDRDDHGFIHVFEYDDDPNNPGTGTGELIAQGIKKGAGESSAVYYTSRVERHPQRPELITKTVQFDTPVTDSLSSSGNVSEIIYEFTSDPPGPDDPMRCKTIVAAPTPITFGSPATKYSVRKEVYDNEGRLNWSGRGSVSDPVTLAGAIEFYLDYYGFNELGQLVLTVMDVGENAPSDVPAPPAELVSRVPSEGALDLTTRHTYDPMYGLIDTLHSNGRRTHIAYLELGGNVLEQWLFNDLIQEGGSLRSLSPVQITQTQAGRILHQKSVRVQTLDSEPDGLGAEENFEVIAITTPTYDEHGRIVGVNKQGADETSVSANVLYNGLGNIERGVAPDGTLTRFVYDELGRPLRKYQGTKDVHPYWGTADPFCEFGEDPVSCDCDCTTPEEVDDNMVLVEKSYYGIGVHNAGELIATRSYRSEPNNPYFEVPLEEPYPDGYEPPLPNNEDEIGWVTLTKYDWRMRPVIQKRCSSDGSSQDPEDVGAIGEAINHSVTWYDNLDRPRYVAEYGPNGVPSSISPELAAPGASPPDATSILSAGGDLISLTETIYNARGLVEENRTYDVNSTNTTYAATLTYYGYHDKPLEVVPPSGPIMRYIYDSKARQVSSRAFAGGGELTRTDYVYGDNAAFACACAADSVVQTLNWEATYDWFDPEPDAQLNEANSVKMYTHSWYDESGKLIATANFGTNTEGDTFETGPAPTYDPLLESAPVIILDGKVTGINPSALPDGAGEWALVTGYAYDKANRQEAVFHPDGTVTRNEYDDLGRQLLMIENADDTDPILRRLTAYHYNTAGQLDAIAAVLPQHGATTYDEINWSADDGSLQVTSIEYGAHIVAHEGNGISANNTLIKAVRFPDRETGQPAAAADLTFTYYPDGTVASRTDANGNTLNYLYDEIGRLVEVAVAEGGSLPTDAPDSRVRRIEYGYLPDGRVETATLYSAVSDVAAACGIKYSYDTRQNLVREHQSHGGAAGVSTPFIQYIHHLHSFPNEGGRSTDRLAHMFYPFNGTTTLAFDYQTDADYLMGRITEIESAIDGSMARYGYAGLSRRVYGGVGEQADDLTFSLYPEDEHDRFGRVIDRAYRNNSGEAIQRFEYAYDKAGNRTAARRGMFTQTEDNASWVYGYDDLNRLVTADFGRLDNDLETFYPDGEISYLLDNLGNWSGGYEPQQVQESISVLRTGDYVGAATLHHQTNARNEITELYRDDALVAGFVYDSNGNLLYDGRYLYDYDAFNRLIRVRDGTDVVITAGPGPLVEPGPNNGTLEIHYIYDALGRLMRKAVYDDGVPQYCYDYYYDGVRRVMDVFTPDADLPAFDSSGQPDGDTTIEREYVYGPDYVDEFIYQYAPDEWPAPLLMLQDANYNVTALVDQQTWDEDWTVLVEYNWDPYGRLMNTNEVLGASGNPVGHQGLFFDRFSSNASLPPLDGETAVVGAPAGPFSSALHGLYYNRNRWYAPELGRFIQRDPNETAMTLIAAEATNGAPISPFQSEFNVLGHFGDGMNLYGYLTSNPVRGRDPLGLTSLMDTGFSTATGAAMWADMTLAVAKAGSFIQGMIGAIGAYSYSMSVVAIMSAGTMDPAAFAALAEESSRFLQWAGGNADRAAGFQQGVGNSPVFDPNNFPGGRQRFEHTLKHAREWFGLSKNATLSGNQLAEWAKAIDHVLRSNNTFQWSTGGQPTIARLAKIDGKYLCVQVYQSTGEMATAFVAKGQTLQDMLAKMGGG